MAKRIEENPELKVSRTIGLNSRKKINNKKIEGNPIDFNSRKKTNNKEN